MRRSWLELKRRVKTASACKLGRGSHCHKNGSDCIALQQHEAAVKARSVYYDVIGMQMTSGFQIHLQGEANGCCTLDHLAPDSRTGLGPGLYDPAPAHIQSQPCFKLQKHSHARQTRCKLALMQRRYPALLLKGVSRQGLLHLLLQALSA